MEQHSCCACLDTRRVRRDLSRADPGFGQAVPCPSCTGSGAAEAIDIVAALRRMRVPARYFGARIATWQPATGAPRIAAEQWVYQWPPAKPMLVLSGAVGTGKTHLAVGVMAAAFEEHRQWSVFWPVVDLLARYRASYDDEQRTETPEQIDRELRRIGLLVLDDWGKQAATAWAEERLFAQFDLRYREGLPTVVTTNVSGEQLPPAVLDRLGDRASSVVVQFDGPSRRLMS